MTQILIGYARCSTDKQDLAAQKGILVSFGVASDRIYTGHGFTGTNRARPGLDQALAALREGDTLVVPKTEWMAPAARRAIETFRKSGGRVLPAQQINRIAPQARITPRHRDIRCTKRVWKGHALYFLTNEALRPVRASRIAAITARP